MFGYLSSKLPPSGACDFSKWTREVLGTASGKPTIYTVNLAHDAAKNCQGVPDSLTSLTDSPDPTGRLVQFLRGDTVAVQLIDPDKENGVVYLSWNRVVECCKFLQARAPYKLASLATYLIGQRVFAEEVDNGGFDT